MFGSVGAVYDVLFKANVGAFRGDVNAIRAAAKEGYGGISTESLRASVIQEKYDRALAHTVAGSYQANRATLTYRKELAQLRAEAGHTTGALEAEERSLARVARGALAGSGALGQLRRAAIFAGSSFLGGYGLAYAFKTVISAAEDEQVALGHLELALHNAGLAWDKYGARVEEAGVQLERASGFHRGEINDALAANVRRFGDVEKAIRATATASDVARAKDISLADAQSLVQRASFGNARSARQLGIAYTATTANVDRLRETTRHATTEQVAQAKAADVQANRLALLAQIDAKFHGSAARYLQTTAGKQALFNAELRDTEAIIGTALLPAFNRVLGSLTDWLGKSDNQARIQRDVNEAVHVGGIAFHTLGVIIKPVAATVRVFGDAVGGTKHEVEILTAALTALWVRSKLIKWGLLSTEIRGVGAAAGEAGAAGGVGALSGKLRQLARIGVISIAFRFPGLADGLSALAGLGFALGGLGAADIAAILASKGDQGAPPKSDPHLGQYAGSKHPLLDKLEHSFGTLPPDQLAIYRDYRAGKITEAQAESRLEKLTSVNPAVNPAVSGPPRPSKADKSSSGAKTSPTPGAGAAADTGYKPSGVQGLDLAIAEAQASGNQAAIAAAARAKLAYDTNAAAFARRRIAAGKGSPSLVRQLENVLSDEASQRATLDAIQRAGDSAGRKAASAALKAIETRRKQLENRVAAAAGHAEKEPDSLKGREGLSKAYAALIAFDRKEAHDAALSQSERAQFAARAIADSNAAQRKIDAARKAQLARLFQIPDNLKAAVNLAKNEQQQLAALKAELKAVDEQLVTMRKLGATKEQIAKNRLTASEIQKRINSLSKTQVSNGGELIREFLTGLEQIRGQGSNVYNQGSSPDGLHVTVEQHFPHPPTDDGHREAIYARRAALAAFDS